MRNKVFVDNYFLLRINTRLAAGVHTLCGFFVNNGLIMVLLLLLYTLDLHLLSICLKDSIGPVKNAVPFNSTYRHKRLWYNSAVMCFQVPKSGDTQAEITQGVLGSLKQVSYRTEIVGGVPIITATQVTHTHTHTRLRIDTG